MKRLLLTAVAALSLAACATPVVYQPATSARASGYVDQRIEADRYRVSFRGAGPGAQINDYALLRAAELTLERGYDWFRVVNRSEDVSGYGGGYGGSRMSVGVGGGNFGRRSGVGVGLGVSTGLGGGGGLPREVALEIKLGRGPTPSQRDVYDARSVARSVRSRM